MLVVKIVFYFPTSILRSYVWLDCERLILRLMGLEADYYSALEKLFFNS